MSVLTRRLVAWAVAALFAAPVLAAPRFGVKTIAVGNGPERLLSVPSIGLVFVVVGDDHLVQAIRVADDTVVDTLHLGSDLADRPRVLAFDEARERLIVVTKSRVKAFERPSGRFELVAEVDTTLVAPYSGIWDPGLERLVVSDPLRPGGGLGVIEGPALDFRVEYEGDFLVFNLIDDASGELVIVPDAESPSHAPGHGPTGEVALLDATDLSIRGDRYDSIFGVFSGVYNPGNGRVYLLTYNPNSAVRDDLQFLDTRTSPPETWLIAVGQQAWDLALDRSADVVYVANAASPFISKVDGADLDAGRHISTPIALPDPAKVVVLDAPLGLLYAVDQARSKVSVIDLATELVTASYAVGRSPGYSIVDRASHKLYTADYYGGTVSTLVPLADPGLSRVWADPEYIDSETRATSTIWVEPRDDKGQRLGPGHTVLIDTTAGALLDRVRDHGDGLYSQLLQSTGDAETAIVSANVDTVDLAERPRVSFQLIGYPDVRDVEPDWGLTYERTEVLIHGQGFTDPHPSTLIKVFFGADEALDVTVIDDRRIRAGAPPHAPGLVDVAVEKRIIDERRTAWLRGGFTYVDEGPTELKMTETEIPGEVRMVWSDAPSTPITMVRSTSKDFTADRVEVPSVRGSEMTEIAPLERIIYYRIER